MLRYFLLVVCIDWLGTDGICLAWEKMDINTTETILANTSDCCFINSSMVRNSDNIQLIIVDQVDDYLVVTDGTDLFRIPKDTLDCKDKACGPKTEIIYAIQTTINCIVVLLAASIIALHLFSKDLRTEFGILVVLFCSDLLVSYVVSFLYNRYQFTHKVGDSGTACAILVYVRTTFVFIYHSTVVTIFFHFAYLMYNAYKLRTVGPNLNTNLICKYITFIITLTTIYMSILIPYDVMVSRNAFTVEGGYCSTEFGDKTKGSWLALIALLLIIIFVQMLLFGIGVVLYFLISRNTCEFRTIDVGVCLLLVSTSGLGAVMFVISYFFESSKSTCVPFLLTSVGTLVQELILLIMSLKKVVQVSETNSCKDSCLYGCTHVYGICIRHRVQGLPKV